MICSFIRSQRTSKRTEPAAIIYVIFLSLWLSALKGVVLNNKTSTAAPLVLVCIMCSVSEVYCSLVPCAWDETINSHNHLC